MHIAVFGAGSIGGYVGAKLAASGRNVTLVDAWSAHVEAIRKSGMRLVEEEGETAVAARAIHLHEVLHQLRTAPVNLAILSVKSYDTAWMTTLIREVLAPDGVVVSLQNGMNDGVISGVVGKDRVLGCTLTRLGSELVAPGVIRRSLYRPSDDYAVFRVGELSGAPSARAERIVDALRLVDTAKLTSNLPGERWSKLTQNAMASGISPLANVSLKELFDDPDYERVLVQIGCEGIRVGQALGLRLENICAIAPESWLAAQESEAAYGAVHHALAPWRSGMNQDVVASSLHDIRRGRRTEIQSINGAIVSCGRELGIATPLNRRLTDEVLRAERRAPEVQFMRKSTLLGLLQADAATEDMH